MGSLPPQAHFKKLSVGQRGRMSRKHLPPRIILARYSRGAPRAGSSPAPTSFVNKREPIRRLECCGVRAIAHQLIVDEAKFVGVRRSVRVTNDRDQVPTRRNGVAGHAVIDRRAGGGVDQQCLAHLLSVDSRPLTAETWITCARGCRRIGCLLLHMVAAGGERRNRKRNSYEPAIQWSSLFGRV